MAESYGIWNDQQIPYHDPRAFSVAVQIFADAKLHTLVFNGDWGDYMSIATHDQGDRDDLYEGIQREIDRQREQLDKAMRAIKPKRAKWNDGNHEFRVRRALYRDPKLACQVLKIKYTEMQLLGSVRQAVSIPALLGLAKHKIEYRGNYPKGCWLKDGLAEHENVYVQHSYIARKKSGYTVSALMDDHWCSQIIGHCEKLAGPIWARKMGRDFFGIENGNLSLIGEPEYGDDIYSGPPHSDPKLMNHRQGISIVYWDGGWHPFTIKIRDGKAFWNGKLYRA